MKWDFYNNKFYQWLDADPTGNRWEWYGMILFISALIVYGLIIWYFEI